jgi:tetratricopeptide (TPR) repeat protein
MARGHELMNRVRRIAVASAMALVPLTMGSAATAHAAEGRIITLRVAVDEQYRVRPTWEADVRAVIREMSATWERRFGIRWDVGAIVPWTSPGDLTLGPGGYTTGELTHTVARGSEEVLLFVSGRPCSRGLRGAASSFGAEVAILMECPGWRGAPLAPRERVLSHELAHLFGAFHVATRSLMNLGAGASDDFDDQTDRVIRLMSDFRFAAGIEGVDDARRHAWLAIFAEGHAADEENLIARALRNRGMAFARTKNYGEASRLLREALRLNPRLSTAHVDLGIIASEQGRVEEAIREFRSALAIDPKSASAQASLGKVLLRTQHAEEGLRALRAAIALEPSRASHRLDMGRGLFTLGRLQEALGEFRAAADLDPNNPGAHRYLGDLMIRQKDYASAERALRTAIRLEPESATTHALLGGALSAQNKLDESLSVLQTAVRLDQSSVIAHANLGYTHAQRGEWPAAVSEYREALRIDPTHLTTHVNLANAYLQQRSFDEAADELREILRLTPDAHQHRLTLGRVLTQLRKLEEASAEFRELLQRSPRAAPAHYYLAVIYAATRRYADAWDEVGRAEALGLQIPSEFLTGLGGQMPRPASR